MKNLALILFCVLLATNCLPQKTFTDKLSIPKSSLDFYITKILKAANNDLFVTAISKGSAVYISRIKDDGKVAWQKKYATGICDNLVTCATSDNGIVAFVSNYDGPTSIFAFKCDSLGNIKWQQKITPQNIALYNRAPKHAIEDEKKNVILLYQLSDVYNGSDDQIGIIRFDKKGQILFHTCIKNLSTVGVIQNFHADAITETFDGGYLIGFEYQDAWLQTGQEGYLLRLGPDGKVIYQTGTKLNDAAIYDDFAPDYIRQYNGKYFAIFSYLNTDESYQDPTKGWYYYVTTLDTSNQSNGTLINHNPFALQKYFKENKIAVNISDFAPITKKSVAISYRNQVRKYDSLNRNCSAGDTIFSYDTSTRTMFVYGTAVNNATQAFDSLVIELVTIKASETDLTKRICFDKDLNFAEANTINEIDLSTPNQIAPYIFPNPAKNNFTLVIQTKKSEPCEISILDMNGKVLQTSKTFFSAGAFEKNINIAFLSPGIYSLKVTSASTNNVLKFVKQ